MDTPSARSRAQSHFKPTDQREDSLRTELEQARAATDAKTARLKALRLAKEAAEKVTVPTAKKPRTVGRKAAIKSPS